MDMSTDAGSSQLPGMPRVSDGITRSEPVFPVQNQDFCPLVVFVSV